MSDRGAALARAPAAIFVANYSNSVIVYASGQRGNVPPDWMMGQRLTPAGIARDAAGKIFVTNRWLDSISVFAADAEGAAAPIAIIRGSRTGLDLPNGIAIDAKGKTYVVNGSADYDRPPGRIDVYPPRSNGNAASIAVITGRHTRLENPQDVAVDSSGKIYVTDLGGDDKESPDRVMVFAAGSTGDVTPIAVIIGGRTALDLPNGIAVDARGTIYLCCECRLRQRARWAGGGLRLRSRR